MIHIYLIDDSGAIQKDLTEPVKPPFGGGFVFATNKHGFAEASIPFVPDAAALRYLELPGTQEILAVEDGQVVYHGRVEDLTIMNNGVGMTAFGLWRAMSDAPYTALWSVDTSADWRPVPNGSLTNRNSTRFTFDNNNRIFVATQKNAVYSASMAGAQIYYAPDAGERDFAEVEFDYEFNMSSSWTARLVSATDDLASTTTQWTLVGNGSTQTGSVTQAVAANRQAIIFEIANTSGGDVTESAESGVNYLKITNIRLKSKSGSVLASDVVADVVNFVNGVNSAQLSSYAGLIEATSDDLQGVMYLDEYPDAILDELADLSGYEVGIWEDKRLHFRERGSQAQTFFIDVSELELERSLDPLRNSVYATYRDANGRVLRTAAAVDEDNLEAVGITRRAVVNVNSADSGQAETARDALLADKGDYALRAKIVFEGIYNATADVPAPLSSLRAGDLIVIRNLSLAQGTAVDNFRVFRAQFTRLNVVTGVMDIEPAVPLPTLVTLVAKV